MNTAFDQLDNLLADYAEVLTSEFRSDILDLAREIRDEAAGTAAEVRAPRSGITTNDPATVESLLREAVDSDGILSIQYRDAAGVETSRTISPFEFRPGSGFQAASVIATDLDKDDETDDGIRRFRIDRIQRVTR